MLARRLIDTFDLSHVFGAPAPRPTEIDGVGFAVLTEIERSRARCCGWEPLLDYCRTVMAHREPEQFCVLFLDRRNVLVAEGAMCSSPKRRRRAGQWTAVPTYPREVVKRALEQNPSALILARSHTWGDQRCLRPTLP